MNALMLRIVVPLPGAPCSALPDMLRCGARVPAQRRRYSSKQRRSGRACAVLAARADLELVVPLLGLGGGVLSVGDGLDRVIARFQANAREADLLLLPGVESRDRL